MSFDPCCTDSNAMSLVMSIEVANLREEIESLQHALVSVRGTGVATVEIENLDRALKNVSRCLDAVVPTPSPVCVPDTSQDTARKILRDMVRNLPPGSPRGYLALELGVSASNRRHFDVDSDLVELLLRIGYITKHKLLELADIINHKVGGAAIASRAIVAGCENWI